MASILVLVGGGVRDEINLRTAYAAAAPLGAHLDVLHVHVTAAVAMGHDAHAQFAVGAGVHSAFDDLDTRAAAYSQLAADHVRDFVEVLDAASEHAPVTASYREEHDTTLDRLIAETADSDLVVIGRSRQTQGLAPSTLENLLRRSGRPLLIPAKAAVESVTETMMVAWDGSANVRATVESCAALLACAQRLVFVSIGTLDADATAQRDAIMQDHAGAGVATECKIVPKRGSVAETLAAAAGELDASLLVMGAYGRWRLREVMLGSCTEEALSLIDRPILLMHASA